MMLMAIKHTHKILFLVALGLFLAGPIAAQPGDVAFEKVTIKPELKVEAGTVKKIYLFSGPYEDGKVILEIENAKGEIKQYKKEIKSGYDYYFELIYEK